MNIEPFKVRILIINNDSAETDTIRSWLKKDMRVPWAMAHCIKVEEARSRANKADLVILKPEMEGMSSPKEVFKDIEDMVFEVPILVLTSEGDEHGLSTYVMEQGAADTIVRGQFARLVDAIEFALIRQRRRTDTRTASHKTLSDSQKQGANDLQDSRANHLADQERHKQILRMFSGDYAVDQQDKPNT